MMKQAFKGPHCVQCKAYCNSNKHDVDLKFFCDKCFMKRLTKQKTEFIINIQKYLKSSCSVCWHRFFFLKPFSVHICTRTEVHCCNLCGRENISLNVIEKHMKIHESNTIKLIRNGITSLARTDSSLTVRLLPTSFNIATNPTTKPSLFHKVYLSKPKVSTEIALKPVYKRGDSEHSRQFLWGEGLTNDMRQKICAFILWTEKERVKTRHANPKITPSKIAKLLIVKWRYMTDEDKGPYYNAYPNIKPELKRKYLKVYRTIYYKPIKYITKVSEATCNCDAVEFKNVNRISCLGSYSQF